MKDEHECVSGSPFVSLLVHVFNQLYSAYIREGFIGRSADALGYYIDHRTCGGLSEEYRYIIRSQLRTVN